MNLESTLLRIGRVEVEDGVTLFECSAASGLRCSDLVRGYCLRAWTNSPKKFDYSGLVWLAMILVVERQSKSSQVTTEPNLDHRDPSNLSCSIPKFRFSSSISNRIHSSPAMSRNINAVNDPVLNSHGKRKKSVKRFWSSRHERHNRLCYPRHLIHW